MVTHAAEQRQAAGNLITKEEETGSSPKSGKARKAEGMTAAKNSMFFLGSEVLLV